MPGIASNLISSYQNLIANHPKVLFDVLLHLARLHLHLLAHRLLLLLIFALHLYSDDDDDDGRDDGDDGDDDRLLLLLLVFH